MASLPTEIVIRLDETTGNTLERLILALDRLSAALEQQREKKQPGAGPYLTGDDE
jgi:hypothetical protein